MAVSRLLQEVLGVLFNLSREFDRAKEAFRKAIALRPNSYALWNRLGATQANNAESAPAIDAYQKVCSGTWLPACTTDDSEEKCIMVPVSACFEQAR